jgi:ABC-type proline/glycine betaine transport system ATPase subunit
MTRSHGGKSSADLEVLTGRCRRDRESERSKAKICINIPAIIGLGKGPKKTDHGRGTALAEGSGPTGFRIKGRLWLEKDGETKRLGIARALVIEPEVFCLDEPTTNLDHKHAEII